MPSWLMESVVSAGVDWQRPLGDSPDEDWMCLWVEFGDSLVDNVALAQRFRDKFVRGLGWLIRNDKLKLNDEWRQLRDPCVRRRWLKSLRESDWNVFIQAPPHGKSDPLQVVKYLTRYMTGGPISDGRIECDEQGMVTFTARSKSKGQARNKQPRQIKVPGSEFVRRWSLHVLPKGFTRSRGYGGFHGSRRKAYLETCRQLLPANSPDANQKVEPTESTTPATGPKCPRCQIEMECIVNIPRPSWRDILSRRPGQPQQPDTRWLASPWRPVPHHNHPAPDPPVFNLPVFNIPGPEN